tara:strand:+ start:1952 stop:2545 length:594 start_codon:yes stop_codon:yes gene_type:complete
VLPLINDYVIELPQLIDIFPSKSKIEEYALKSYNSSSCSPTFETDWDGVIWYSYNDDLRINKICDLLHTRFLSKPPEAWICFKKTGSWVRPHIDVKRRAVLVYPINPETYTLEFTDNGASTHDFFIKSYNDTVDYNYNVIYKHNYTCPTICNTQVHHSVTDTSSRLSLQISLYYDGNETDTWDKIVNLYKTGEIINE